MAKKIAKGTKKEIEFAKQWVEQYKKDQALRLKMLEEKPLIQRTK